MKVEMCVLRRTGALERVSVETRTVAKGSRFVLMRRVRERRETLTARHMHRRTDGGAGVRLSRGWSDAGHLEFSRDALNGTISPIDPTDTPKGVSHDSSHDP